MFTLSTSFVASIDTRGANGVSMVRAADGNYIIVNGQQRPLRWDGITAAAELAGITASTTAPVVTAGSSGGSTAWIWGTYYVYYRYCDDADTPSNLSPVTTFTTTATNKAKYLAISGDGSSEVRVTKVQIWRSTAGQNNTVYLDTSKAITGGVTTSWAVTTFRSDCALKTCESLRILTEDGYPNADRFTPPPEYMCVAICHKDRVWYMGACGAYSDTYRTTVYWSEIGEPESVPSINSAIIQDEFDAIIGGFSAFGYLYVYTRNKLYRFATAGDPRRDLTITCVATRGGCSSRAWCLAEGTAFMLDDHGIHAFNGVSSQPINDPVVDKWHRDLSATAGVNCAALPYYFYWIIHSPEERTVKFFLPLETTIYGWESTDAGSAICLNLKTGAWSREDYPFRSYCGTNFRVDSKQRTMLGGRAYAQALPYKTIIRLMNCGPLDVASHKIYHDTLSTMSEVRGTLTSVGTNIIYDASVTWPPTSGLTDSGLSGAAVGIDAAWGAEARNLSTISTTHIHHAAFTQSPSAGDTYQIGGIPWKVKLGAFKFIESERANARRLHLYFEPLSEGAAYVRFYFDHSTSPEASVISYDNADGVSVSAGQSAFKVDLTNTLGYAQISIDDGFELRGPANRIMEVQLDGIQGRDSVKIYGIDIDGVME